MHEDVEVAAADDSPPIGLLQFRPILKRIRWGGRRLGTALHKPLGDADDYAESWEVSGHPSGESVVDGGPFDGRTLTELAEAYPEMLMGPRRPSDSFPLLIKFLDAHDRLSVQVHPDDARAQRFQPGENGKTEAWVILDASRGSRLFVGLKPGVNRAALRTALEAGTIERCLHGYAVSRGDCVFIPAGTVHAIGEGILLAEVQQSSNLTFRLYDWGRVGADGAPRTLHIEEALDCVDFERGPVDPVRPRIVSSGGPLTELLVDCAQFAMRRHTCSAPFDLYTRNSFRVFVALEGVAEVSAENDRRDLPRGKTLLVPACRPSVRIAPRGGGELVLLEVGVGGGGNGSV
ncbi:MAG: type I phosphomannose isomerase catalytic subunit [Planctomycetaceae bacterium]